MRRIMRSGLAAAAFVWAGYVSAEPITDTVVVDSAEWAQVDLFVGLAWSEINRVCPAGVCGSGTLNGFDMAGWTWAGIEDTNNLFNHYIGFAALGLGTGSYGADANTFTDLFFADGWRPTSNYFGDSQITTGYNLESAAHSSVMMALGPSDLEFICSLPGLNGVPCELDRDYADTNDLGVESLFPAHGAWFVRAAVEVPGPSTLPLLALALALIGYRRTKLS